MTHCGKTSGRLSAAPRPVGTSPEDRRFHPEMLRRAPAVFAWTAFAILLAGLAPGFPQNQPPPKSFIGTVTSLGPGGGGLEIKPDKGQPVSVNIVPGTMALKVEPGEIDLKKAQPIQVSSVTVGDRVLVTLEGGTTDARRIIVMSASDIEKRNEEERLDWIKRGVSGVVTAKSGNQITVRHRILQGPVDATVTVDTHTVFKRYAPDSVKFADAGAGSLAEISVGDQLRARGQKSEDGLKVTAEEVVFGTFLTKAGTILSVNSESREVTVKELGTGKTLLIRLTADSQLKKMPDFGGTTPNAGRQGFAPRGGDSSGRRMAAGGPPRGPMGGAAGQRDISQMLDRMPAATIADLKQGETIVVSSTKGTQPDQLTAIMLVANADMLIRITSMQPGANRERGAGGRGMNGGMMGQMESLGGFELPGMFP